MAGPLLLLRLRCMKTGHKTQVVNWLSATDPLLSRLLSPSLPSTCHTPAMGLIEATLLVHLYFWPPGIQEFAVVNDPFLGDWNWFLNKLPEGIPNDDPFCIFHTFQDKITRSRLFQFPIPNLRQLQKLCIFRDTTPSGLPRCGKSQRSMMGKLHETTINSILETRYGGFHKWGYPKVDNHFLENPAMIWRYPHLWKPPYESLCTWRKPSPQNGLLKFIFWQSQKYANFENVQHGAWLRLYSKWEHHVCS